MLPSFYGQEILVERSDSLNDQKKSVGFLLDIFIPQQLQRDLVHYRRCQILTAVVVLNIVGCLASALTIGLGGGLGGSNTIIAYAAVGNCTFLYCLALLLLRTKGWLLLAANMAVMAIFSTLLISTVITGGYRDSPFAQMFVVLPLLGFLLAGFTSGIFWSVMTICSLFGLLFVDQVLNFYYQLLSAEEVSSFSRAMPLVTVSLIIFALMIYESINMNLKRQLSRERNRFAFRASHDSLTDLPNREEFYLRLRRGIEDAEATETLLALLYIDLDGFKPINDSYGHHAGDKVLKVLSSRMRGLLRQHDTVARLGGDEFAIILPGLKQQADISPIIDKTLAAIADPIEIDGTFVIVHGSIGVALCPHHSTNSDTLCRLADKAMYKAKEKRNTFAYADPTTTLSGLVIN